MNYLFIGHGRVAKHLGHYLNHLGHKVSIWSRRSDVAIAPLIRSSDVVCLSTRDSEIQGVIEAYDIAASRKPIVHFSGSQSVENALGFHPLMSFGPETYPIETYKACHFFGPSSPAKFQELFPKLANPYHSISSKHLARYHAYCSMAGNFPQILWDEIGGRFESEMGLPKEALDPYIHQITQNFLQQHEASITGPLVRNDTKTVVRHLDSLSDSPLQNIYFGFLNLFKKKSQLEDGLESRRISPNQI